MQCRDHKRNWLMGNAAQADSSWRHCRALAIIMSVAIVITLMMATGCSHDDHALTDSLNARSYYFHYRNLDSTTVYARRALLSAGGYDGGRAEAMNNLSFVDIARMRYKQAFARLDSVSSITDNQVELLVADIQLMRLCQRESRNREFYDYHERARQRLNRIHEDDAGLDDHSRRRLVYAESEFHIITSTYYYYVGLERQSIAAMNRIDIHGDVQRDTAQMLAYYYNIGSGGFFTTGTQAEINQNEFDCLLRCYLVSLEHGYSFWTANALQSMSEHLLTTSFRRRLISDNLPAMKFLNIDMVADSMLAGNMAERSLSMFKDYGDVYQTAGSYRTLASCYWQINDYQDALISLNNSLTANRAIDQAPDLVASIREQMSVVCSAINDKAGSDMNRNIYLDLQEQTRQDRYLEARASQLDKTATQLNWMIAAVVVAIIVVVTLLIVFAWLRRRADRRSPLESLLEPLQQWQKRSEKHRQQLLDRYDEINEAKAVDRAHVASNKRRSLEQRAKISLVNSLMPLIDRMLHEIHRLERGGEDAKVRSERYEYISELTDQINVSNQMLTEWIQLRQGQLQLHIESFRLQDLFDIIARSVMAYKMKGISLNVEPTAAAVKADKVLTLFMLNTLADNARKATPQGGSVTVSARAADKYVEISVADTGCGIAEEKLAHIFDHKAIVDSAVAAKGGDEPHTSHGFGLMNCQGIINKYHKISSLFSVCMISAESTVGKDSRFFFRLPKGIVRMVAALAVMAVSLNASATVVDQADHADKTMAAAYCDSVYASNIDERYAVALSYADSVRQRLNNIYLRHHPRGRQVMLAVGNVSSIPAEVGWLHDSIDVDYGVILSMRNECAVAALALHQWGLYRYNNRVYTLLFKELSADHSLEEYCRTMQRSEANKNVAIVMLLILLLLIFPAYYFIYYRHRLAYGLCLERVGRINEILLTDKSASEKLRLISPIASDRYPEKIRNIVARITEALAKSVEDDKASLTNIELADDELRQARYEDERLHVQNSILDNCLSTLKHETMYYPSRIRLLVDGGDSNLKAIGELAEYYKELYGILSLQAMRQVEAMHLTSRRIGLTSVLPSVTGEAADGTPPDGISLIGDEDMIGYLFDLLKKQNRGRMPEATVMSRHTNKQYVVIRMHLDAVTLTNEQCHKIFDPKIENVDYLLCRQIARDNGEASNHRGCGITAVATPKGTDIIVALTRA